MEREVWPAPVVCRDSAPRTSTRPALEALDLASCCGASSPCQHPMISEAPGCRETRIIFTQNGSGNEEYVYETGVVNV